MSAQPELKPCGHCGSADVDAEFWRTSENSGPGCMNCGATAETVELWNTRVSIQDESAPPAQEPSQLPRQSAYKRDERLQKLFDWKHGNGSFYMPADADSVMDAIEALEAQVSAALEREKEMEAEVQRLSRLQLQFDLAGCLSPEDKEKVRSALEGLAAIISGEISRDWADSFYKDWQDYQQALSLLGEAATQEEKKAEGLPRGRKLLKETVYERNKT